MCSRRMMSEEESSIVDDVFGRKDWFKIQVHGVSNEI
jgi:hypothetical protein